MKRRFTEEQIIGILRKQEAGGTVKEVTRRRGATSMLIGHGVPFRIRRNRAESNLPPQSPHFRLAEHP
jgi:hypothetical protein